MNVDTILDEGESDDDDNHNDDNHNDDDGADHDDDECDTDLDSENSDPWKINDSKVLARYQLCNPNPANFFASSRPFNVQAQREVQRKGTSNRCQDSE
ncbi:hypothetical protein HYPSUDRAFT_36966 [Hypholoma sublateritium FD-334 SS-4]|uniref:Uncharacterized protein n=1 Tax=Hypholoma sublateritium (strain FD-334 SS-4) TaxID=945553 RepID=A0A0D2Q3E6_HYPSF|nr:hypothetical protein HYPSUDRAFT_36966 [Hypholoma sublateritium FD-334 SS-4]